MDEIIERIKNEPARVLAFAQSVIILAGAFGFNLADDQRSAILTVIAIVLSFVVGESVRAQVTPVRKLPPSDEGR